MRKPQKNITNWTEQIFVLQSQFFPTENALIGSNRNITLTQVHIIVTRAEHRLQEKAVELKCCIGCLYYDWWNGECMYDDICPTTNGFRGTNYNISSRISSRNPLQNNFITKELV